MPKLFTSVTLHSSKTSECQIVAPCDHTFAQLWRFDSLEIPLNRRMENPSILPPRAPYRLFNTSGVADRHIEINTSLREFTRVLNFDLPQLRVAPDGSDPDAGSRSAANICLECPLAVVRRTTAREAGGQCIGFNHHLCTCLER
jgi:hypothetical protein